tara:strand:+ start:563 stop:955 length:393 start_codon:yes stop_codon:yes gene_type:complete
MKDKINSYIRGVLLIICTILVFDMFFALHEMAIDTQVWVACCLAAAAFIINIIIGIIMLYIIDASSNDGEVPIKTILQVKPHPISAEMEALGDDVDRRRAKELVDQARGGHDRAVQEANDPDRWRAIQVN